jgi:hypothetical protein
MSSFVNTQKLGCLVVLQCTVCVVPAAGPLGRTTTSPGKLCSTSEPRVVADKAKGSLTNRLT